VLLMIAWCLWMLIAMLWTPDRASGWRELANSRWAWTMLVAYSVMDRRPWLIAALCFGVALGNGAQALEWIGHRSSIDWLIWPHPPNPQPVPRISGWWHHPVMGGIVLVGGLGLHLGAAVLGRGWKRWAGIAGSLACVVGIFATGTRGAWLAGMGLVALVIFGACCTLPKKKAIMTLAAAAAGLLLALGAGWAVAGPQISYRIKSGFTELRQAAEGTNLTSDMGARVRYAGWAAAAIREHPILGVGTGGYQHFVVEHVRKQGVDPSTVRIAPQAHNTFLHAWATTGIPGVILCVGLMIVAIASGIRAPFARRAETGLSSRAAFGAWLGTYSAGPTVALIGIALMSLFDVPYVNVQTAGFTSALLALTVGSEWDGWSRKPLF
jgi:O-antigen ligase